MEAKKRTTMKKPSTENNAVEKALMDGVGKWVNEFNAFPIPYEIDLVSLAGMVRTAYEEVAAQPAFRVAKAHKGPLWEIEPSEKRVDDPGKFYPHSSSPYEKKKMHAYARFAGARFVLCGLLGGFAKAAALQGSLFFLNKDGSKATILPDDLVVARATSGIWTGTSPKLLIATQGKDGQPGQPRVVPLDSNPEGYHLTVWCKARGNQYLQTDVNDWKLQAYTENTFPAESMNAYAFLSNLKATAERQNLDLDGLTKAVQSKLRAHAKKAKQRLRRKAKKKKKKKKEA